ncbi:MAG: holo-ACP synthase [Bacilli bacterium]|nr:holo-ACP synthase [Bacilli bacterium]
MALGIDIVYIPRIKDADKLAKSVLSDKELEFYSKRNKKEEFLAGRFAAKEAFMKAMEKGLAIPFKKIEVLYKDSGAPYILFEEKTYEVSISHDKDYAIAVVKF